MFTNTYSLLELPKQGTKKNVIKDFVAVAADLSLSHLVAFTQTSLGMYVKFCRLPQGPTITFK